MTTDTETLERITMLKDRMPCISGGRHTFDADATVCLCGALGVGISQKAPHVVLYFPADEPTAEVPVYDRRPDPAQERPTRRHPRWGHRAKRAGP